MITSPSEKSQEAMQAKTQAIPPRVREEVSPLPSGGTEGQVLTMGETEAEWDDIPSQLPEGGTAGQVLTLEVPEGETDPVPAWADVPKELPASLGTAGQVLTVNSGATGVEWADAPSEDTYDIYLKLRNSIGVNTGEYGSNVIEVAQSGYYKNGSTTLTTGYDALKEILFSKSVRVSKLIVDVPTSGSTRHYYGCITPYTGYSCGRVIESNMESALDIRVYNGSINLVFEYGYTAYTAHT